MTRDTPGNYIHYGVREFGMAAIMNGIALHGGFIPYGGTFLTFSDYWRNALRMAALMRIRSIFVFTHDSIGLGEDGPTHQPIEHLASLRLIPTLDVWRPCDTEESLVAWVAALERRDGPTCLVFSRQNLPFQQNARRAAGHPAGRLCSRGAELAPHAVIIATGSEVALAVEAQKLLAEEGIPVRVVSMPSTQCVRSSGWRLSGQRVCRRSALRCSRGGPPDLWHKYVGRTGAVVGIDRFGESAPAGELFELFGFTAGAGRQAVRPVGLAVRHDPCWGSAL